MSYVDHKFIKLISPRLDRFQQKNQNLYNFRCPFCGDSEKNAYKARGYVYLLKNSLVYKCHNCSVGCSLGNLIKAIDMSLYKMYTLEKFKNKDVPIIKKEISYKFDVPKFHSVNPLLEIGAIKLNKCGANHSAIQFMRSRKIPSSFFGSLYYLDDEEKLEQISGKYKDRIIGHSPRILIPYYTEHDELIGLTARAIDPKNSLRYLTLKFSENALMIYGLDRVNKREKIYVVEGPIDSLFLPNCVAASGADFSKIDEILPKDNCVVIFDNEPRNKDIIRQMETMIDNNYKICIWPSSVKNKDINDMIVFENMENEIVGVINKNTFSGLKARISIQNWKRI